MEDSASLLPIDVVGVLNVQHALPDQEADCLEDHGMTSRGHLEEGGQCAEGGLELTEPRRRQLVILGARGRGHH